MKEIRCKSCGAVLDNFETFACAYCGTVDEESRRATLKDRKKAEAENLKQKEKATHLAEQELSRKAGEQTGCLIPLILSIPITVIIVEIWFLIFWGGFSLGFLFDSISRFGFRWIDWSTYVGIIIAWIVALLIGMMIEVSRQRKKLEKEANK